MNEAWQYLAPLDTKIVLWRYIDVGKFESMIRTGSLHFARAEIFRDQMEGHDPQGHRILFPHPNPALSRPEMRITVNHVQEFVGKTLHVSCWNKRNASSLKMWRAYLGSSNGIAVRTSVGRLLESFENPNNIGIGEIEYVNEGVPSLDTDSGVMKYFYKRNKFKFENEIRAIWSDNPYHMRPGTDYAATFGDNGVFLEVDLKELVAEIVVNARRRSNFYKDIAKLAAKQGLSERVRPSYPALCLTHVIRALNCLAAPFRNGSRCVSRAQDTQQED